MPAHDDADLRDLLVAVAARDRAAFHQLYLAAAPKLFGTILRIVRNRAAAEEVLQDVFLRIWENAGRYAPDRSPPNVWMSSIARNRSIDILRQRGTIPLSGADNEVDWLERVAEDRDRERDMVDNASLRECLASLEAEACTCVLLAYYEGFSREELARRFGRPVNTIKTWLHRSLGTLRNCLDGVPL